METFLIVHAIIGLGNYINQNLEVHILVQGLD